MSLEILYYCISIGYAGALWQQKSRLINVWIQVFAWIVKRQIQSFLCSVMSLWNWFLHIFDVGPFVTEIKVSIIEIKSTALKSDSKGVECHQFDLILPLSLCFTSLSRCLARPLADSFSGLPQHTDWIHRMTFLTRGSCSLKILLPLLPERCNSKGRCNSVGREK